MKSSACFGAILLLISFPAAASEEHNVTLQDDAFSPQHITITAGDSVRWTNQGSHPHNVVADDGSFRCAEGCDSPGSPAGDAGPDSYHGSENSPGDPSASNWSFSLTFDEPGTINYHCEAHGSPGVGMFGSVTVEPAEDPPEEPAFEINHGLAGSWYNPATSGQGFLLDFVVAVDPPMLVVYWFTHAQEAGGPSALRWKFVDGRYEPGDSSIDLDVYLVTGGVFDQPDEVSMELIGVATLEFDSCSSAEFAYDVVFDGDEDNPIAGVIPLEPLSPDIEDRCEELAD